MKKNNHKDWTSVLQERLQDATLPVEDGWAAGPLAAGETPGSGPAFPARPGRGGFPGLPVLPWALAGVAAVLAAVLILRPAHPARSVSVREGVLLAQRVDLLPEAIPPARPLRSGSRPSTPSPAGPAYPEAPSSGDTSIPLSSDVTPPSSAGMAGESSADPAQTQVRPDEPGNGEGIPRSLEELTQDDFPEEPAAGTRQRRPLSLRLQVGSSGGAGVVSPGRMHTNGVMYDSDPNGNDSSAGYLHSGGSIISWDSEGQDAQFQYDPVTHTLYQYGQPQGATRFNETRTPVLPVSFGVSAALPMTRRLTLSAGLAYTQRPGTGVITDAELGKLPTVVTWQHAALHYLGIPVDLHCYINPDSRLRFWVGGGLQAEKCIHATGAEMLSEPVLFSANLQAGADFRLLRGVRIYLSPALMHYLNRSSYITTWDERPLFSLRAGLSFDLK